MFVLRSAAFLLAVHQGLQRSQHSDPLAQLPMFALRSGKRFVVHCVTEESAP
jgi:hypothetical protein